MGGAITRSLHLRKSRCYCWPMVGYRESRYSFNDPMDDYERSAFGNAKPGSRGRVLKGGYLGLAKDFFKAVTAPLRFPKVEPGQGKPTKLQLKYEIEQSQGLIDPRLYMQQERPAPKPKKNK